MKTSSLLAGIFSLFVAVECGDVAEDFAAFACGLLPINPACWGHGGKKHGVNCRSSKQCKDVHDDGQHLSKTLEAYINTLSDDTVIPPEVLIACTHTVCAKVTRPKGKLADEIPHAINGKAAKHLAHEIVKHDCHRCGRAQTGYPDVTAADFVYGSLKFEWHDEQGIRDGCGNTEGLCVRFMGGGPTDEEEEYSENNEYPEEGEWEEEEWEEQDEWQEQNEWQEQEEDQDEVAWSEDYE